MGLADAEDNLVFRGGIRFGDLKRDTLGFLGRRRRVVGVVDFVEVDAGWLGSGSGFRGGLRSWFRRGSQLELRLRLYRWSRRGGRTRARWHRWRGRCWSRIRGGDDGRSWDWGGLRARGGTRMRSRNRIMGARRIVYRGGRGGRSGFRRFGGEPLIQESPTRLSGGCRSGGRARLGTISTLAGKRVRSGIRGP